MPKPLTTGDEALEFRQCGRCRGSFPADPTLHRNGLPEWWLCPPCHDVLLGSGQPPTGSQQPPLWRTT
jgi:hypothetical protein